MRIGILGAARIAPAALIRPARIVDGVEVTAVAGPVHYSEARAAGLTPRVT
jgi:predicted dehydrogenase